MLLTHSLRHAADISHLLLLVSLFLLSSLSLDSDTSSITPAAKEEEGKKEHLDVRDEDVDETTFEKSLLRFPLHSCVLCPDSQSRTKKWFEGNRLHHSCVCASADSLPARLLVRSRQRDRDLGSRYP